MCGHDTTKAVHFEIEAEINATSNVRTARFFLAEFEQSPGDTVYNILRNYWYDIKIKMVDPGMDSLYVTVVASPWNTAPAQVDSVGGGYFAETAQPLKLVKQYTEEELGGASWGTSANPNRLFAAIKTHTRGAAWIALKVSDMTNWSLAFKSGPENVGALISKDRGATWSNTLSGYGRISNTSDPADTIFIYRPYREGSEPKEGPKLQLTVGTTVVREFVVQPRDTVPVPTNTYILRPKHTDTPLNESRVYIPMAGVYRHWEDYLLNNGESIPNGGITAELVWQDRLGEVIKTSSPSLSIINNGKRDSAYIYVEAGAVQGNAVISMKVAGKVYWTYHIWVTEYNPYEVAGQKLYSSNIFMDRNLGALKNEYDDAGEARGLFYQFGRSTPMPRGTSWTNNLLYYKGAALALTTAAFTQVTPSPVTALRPKAAINASISTPQSYIGGNPYPLMLEDSCLWATPTGKKTAYDPCPEGWRVPKQTAVGAANSPWSGIDGAYVNPGTDKWQKGLYHVGAGYYPYAGGIHGTSGQNAGTSSLYWTAWKSTDKINGTGMLTVNFSLTPSPLLYYGYSVRCVVDKDYIAAGGGIFKSVGH
jgi:hypothetical protein